MIGGFQVALESTPAAAADCGALGNFYDGQYSSQPSGSPLVIGVIASLTTRTADFPCTTTTGNEYSAWTMLTWNGHYVQTGYARNPTDGANHFFEEDSSSSFHQINYAGYIADGSNNTYASYADPSCGCFREYANLTQLWTTRWSPYAEWGQPWDTQFSGEVQRLPDNMPGTGWAPAAFTDLKARTLFGGDWSATIPNLYLCNDKPPSWGINPAVTCFDGLKCFSIWTN